MSKLFRTNLFREPELIRKIFRTFAWLAILAVPACNTAPAEDAAAPAPEQKVQLALLPPSNESDAAALEGYLHVEDECLYITGSNGTGPRTIPAFLIPGVRWDDKHDRLLAHGKSFAPGQYVRLGGSTASNPELLPWVQAPDPRCDNSASIFVTGGIDAIPEPADRP